MIEIRQVIGENKLVAVDANTGETVALTVTAQEMSERRKRIEELEKSIRRMEELEAQLPWRSICTGIGLIVAGSLLCVPVNFGCSAKPAMIATAAGIGFLAMGIWKERTK